MSSSVQEHFVTKFQWACSGMEERSSTNMFSDDLSADLGVVLDGTHNGLETDIFGAGAEGAFQLQNFFFLLYEVDTWLPKRQVSLFLTLSQTRLSASTKLPVEHLLSCPKRSEAYFPDVFQLTGSLQRLFRLQRLSRRLLDLGRCQLFSCPINCQLRRRRKI